MSELEEAYKNTTYIVYTPQKNIEIRIGKENNDLDLFLEKYNVKKWIFITAYNPYSKQLTDEENENRHLELLKDLKNELYFIAEGKPDDDNWKPEKSLFVIDVEDNKIDYLINKYQQNAIVKGIYKGIPELKFYKTKEPT